MREAIKRSSSSKIAVKSNIFSGIEKKRLNKIIKDFESQVMKLQAYKDHLEKSKKQMNSELKDTTIELLELKKKLKNTTNVNWHSSQSLWTDCKRTKSKECVFNVGIMRLDTKDDRLTPQWNDPILVNQANKRKHFGSEAFGKGILGAME